MSLRDESRKDWSLRGSNACEGEINLGSFQRIADALERQAKATETMALSYDAIRKNRDHFRDLYEASERQRLVLERSIRSLKGVITRLKRDAVSRSSAHGDTR